MLLKELTYLKFTLNLIDYINIDYINISKVLYNYMSRYKCTGGIQGMGLGDIGFSLENISSSFFFP